MKGSLFIFTGAGQPLGPYYGPLWSFKDHFTKLRKTSLFLAFLNLTKGRNIHPCLENPDGPWTHEDEYLRIRTPPELNQQKIIINNRRTLRVEHKIRDILDQLISDAVEKIEEERSSSDDDSGDEETESEGDDQTSGDCSEDSGDDELAQAVSARSCQFCNKGFSTRGNKEYHENYVHKKDPKSTHSCKVDPGCEKVFSNKTSLRYHQLRAHGKAVCCDKCSKEFTDFKEFVKHRRIERGNSEIPAVVKCSICKIPISSQNLKRHKRVVHNEPTKNPLKEPAEMHHCPHCSQQFKRVENMQRHVKDFHSFTNQEKWKCEQCEKSFTLERNLKLHIERVHANFPFYSTFNCHQCEKSFKLKGNLTWHQKEQHSDIKFSCPSCGKSFVRKSQQEQHSYICKKRTK